MQTLRRNTYKKLPFNDYYESKTLYAYETYFNIILYTLY